jgi:ceramide glucosyltransferase
MWAVALDLILATLVALSMVLTLWQLFVSWRFPLHHRTAGRADSAPVTLLKPLKGCDVETSECLLSWFSQDYTGAIQVLFGVASPDDPVCEMVRQLMASHPKLDAELVICSEELGANAKVSTLIQLERRARHEIIVISDADMFAPPDLLTQALAGLHDPGVGLVHCFYEIVRPANLAMRWEAFAINADFWSQVLQAQSLRKIDFALGAVMATSRRQLETIGGFGVLADYIADDYQLGNRIAGSGAQIAFCPVVVESRSPPLNWREVWGHQIRWARTIRVCQPLPYFLSELHNATLWPLLWMVLHPIWPVMLAAGCAITLRMTAGLYCERKLTGRLDLRSLCMAPIKDLLQIVVWTLAFTGDQVTWRGQRFRIDTGGKLIGNQLRRARCDPG